MTYLAVALALGLAPLGGLVQAAEILFDSFEIPDVTGDTSTLPTGWTGTAGLSDYSVFDGDQAAGFYKAKYLETTTAILDTNLVADTAYVLTFKASNATGHNPDRWTVKAELWAGSNLVLTAERIPPDTQPVVSNSVLVAAGDPGIGEALRVRLETVLYQNNSNARYYFDELSLDATSSSDDHDPPSPDPMTWLQPPTPSGGMYMVATEASDPSFVQYMFTNTVKGTSSGWIDDPVWRDTELTDGVTYSYMVRARDRSVNHNKTGWSSVESGVADSQVMLYDSFEYPEVAGTLPPGWAGTARLASYSAFDGDQAVSFPQAKYLETTMEILDHRLVADGEYTITFKASNATGHNPDRWTVRGELWAGSNLVLTAERIPPDIQPVVSNSVLVAAGDPGIGEALKVRLETVQYQNPSGATYYFDSLRLRALLPPPRGMVLILF